VAGRGAPTDLYATGGGSKSEGFSVVKGIRRLVRSVGIMASVLREK
jgi:hypothetical protein